MCISKYLLSFLYQTFQARIFLETIYSLYPCKLLWLSISRQIGFRFDAKRILAETEKKYSIDFLPEIELTGTGFQKKTLFSSGIFAGRLRNLYLKSYEFLCWISRTKHV